MAERRYHGSLIFPVLLIGLGVIFLLNNLGVVDWDIWFVILRLWPLLLVALGLDVLVGRRSTLGAVLSFALILALFAGALWLFYNISPGIGGKVVTEQVSYPLEDINKARIEIDFGVGKLVVKSAKGNANLLSGALDLTEAERLVEDYRVSGGSATLRLGSEGPQVPSRWFLPNSQNDNLRLWDIQLSQAVPLDLSIDAGVGEVALDLRGLDISDFELDGGVGKLTLYLPEEGDFEGYISAGVGEMIIYVPPETAARFLVDGGIGNISFSSDFTHSGTAYVSPAYDSGEDFIDLYIDGGVGSVRVRLAGN